MIKPLLVASSLVVASIDASAQSVHIDFIDGQTGHPLTRLYVECALFSTGDQAPRRVAFTSLASGLDLSTDRSEYLQITAAGSSQQMSHQYGQCYHDSREFMGSFSSVHASEIMATGVNLGEVAGQMKSSLQPGNLRVYVRKASLWQKILDRLYS